jgi:hypothetical protein
MGAVLKGERALIPSPGEGDSRGIPPAAVF